MKYLFQLLQELRDLGKNHTPGVNLPLPSKLSRQVVKGCQLSYIKMGLDDEKLKNPILFVHGFGGFFMDWPRVMTPLSKEHHALALDLPGWGFSESHRGLAGVEDDADIVLGFIEALNLNNVTMVGLSYGAAVGWAMATLHQDPRLARVSRFLFLNPMPPFPLQNMGSFLYRTIFKLNRFFMIAKLANKLISPAQFKRVCKENLRNGRLLETSYLKVGYLVLKQPKVLQNLHLHAKGASEIDWSGWEEKLKTIKHPVHIMQGTHDKIFSIKSAKYLKQLIPSSSLEIVEDCGHAMCFDKPQLIIRKLQEMIGEQIKKAA